MELFTERNNMREPIKSTSEISLVAYSVLYDCCFMYFNTISLLFPSECPDNSQINCGIDLRKFSNRMSSKILSLHFDDNGVIEKPTIHNYKSNHDQYGLLDLIEFIANNCRDIKELDYHKFFNHHHLKTLDSRKVANVFQKDINDIFQDYRLLYKLTNQKNKNLNLNLEIVRLSEYGTISQEIISKIELVKEKGLRYLLNTAVTKFKLPKPEDRKHAVEKLWDAFERLKTELNSNKNNSATKLIKAMSGGNSNFEKLFITEFKTLSDIGNNYTIRHHEIDKINIEF
jgi:hypothetical protein